MRRFLGIDKIFKRLSLQRLKRGVDYYKLNLHFVGNYAFYVDGSYLLGEYVFLIFRKPREIWSKLNEYSVALNASYNAPNGLALRKTRNVFLLAAEKLPLGNVNSAALVNTLDYCKHRISDRDPC